MAVILGLLPATNLRAQEPSDFEKRVEILLSQMTLDEKIGQMVQVDMNALKDKADIQKYFIGSMLSGGDSDPADITAKGWLKACDEYQSWALKTRLKIPLIYGIDAVHGHNNVDGAVIFPHNIGLGATRHPALVEKAARVTASEVADTGIRWAFAPCIAVARDERWGRTYESFGESPDLVAEMGAAEVRGFQRGEFPYPVLACAKHFIGDGGTVNGLDQGNMECDETTLRKVYLPPYISAIKSGVGSIMVSFSSWNGKKMHGNKHLLTDILKGELGFQGFLVSDWAAIDQLSPDYKKDIETAVNAGIDMVMIPNGPGQNNNYIQFISFLKELAGEGRVAQSRIDDATRRILLAKFRLGLFEHPYTDPSSVAGVGSAEHREVARECVRESLVLLKDEHQALPLTKKLKHLHVIGAAADDIGIQCGGWTIDWQGKSGEITHGGTTILTAIRNAAGPDVKVTFSRDGSGAQGADEIIVVIGEMPYAEMKGDRADLRVAPSDAALVRKARESGVPVATILLSGRPLVLGPVLDDSDAMLAAWLPGTEGQGVADVLFGKYKPTGKLPRTWPRNNEQLSIDVDPPGETPLFPYGFGLTYKN